MFSSLINNLRLKTALIEKVVKLAQLSGTVKILLRIISLVPDVSPGAYEKNL